MHALTHSHSHIHEAWGSIRRKWSGGVALQRSETKDVALEHVSYVDGTDLASGEETIFVNASIMSLEYRPSQMPWVVDLMLPDTPENVSDQT